MKGNPAFLVLRCLSSFVLVPILEELFWRGWMMRWLIDTNFLKVPLGKYVPSAFWIVAVLFASEHGPYWEVGLAAGIVYNWWIVRTRNLADCILAHAVTNAVLCRVCGGDRPVAILAITGFVRAYVPLHDRYSEAFPSPCLRLRGADVGPRAPEPTSLQ